MKWCTRNFEAVLLGARSRQQRYQDLGTLIMSEQAVTIPSLADFTSDFVGPWRLEARCKQLLKQHQIGTIAPNYAIYDPNESRNTSDSGIGSKTLKTALQQEYESPGHSEEGPAQLSGVMPGNEYPPQFFQSQLICYCGPKALRPNSKSCVFGMLAFTREKGCYLEEVWNLSWIW
ncbi:hypothetical protein CPB83DRAFT_886809 [Crepidotus variabilis]|uniref:Uncharacterized protein n=1 Tax=Crepidotus variabilis TaxID=179855 RepID=A0A9P6E6S8_9AGAR|nr:hypothetical protein CPB83DRAFT_886809 [Crepidotus variabilis]